MNYADQIDSNIENLRTLEDRLRSADMDSAADFVDGAIDELASASHSLSRDFEVTFYAIVRCTVTVQASDEESALDVVRNDGFDSWDVEVESDDGYEDRVDDFAHPWSADDA
jgi:hypothetical protein